MPRMLDITCPTCGLIMTDVFVQRTPDRIICSCGNEATIMLGTADRRPWRPSEEVVVFRKPNGEFSFPTRNDKPTPPGCERLTARSDRELAAIEHLTSTRSEVRWFDRGSGRGFDDSFNGRKF